MAKINIKPQALKQLSDIISNVIEFTGFEMSGIRLQNDIFELFMILIKKLMK